MLVVTGASGLVGSSVVRAAAAAGLEVFAVSGARAARAPEGPRIHTASVDLSNGAALRALVRGPRFQGPVVHCAAMTDVNACEKDPELAWRVNADASRILAEAAAERSGPFVLLSSHGVFDGIRGGYREDEAPRPLNVYFETKVAAEADALRLGGCVVRIVPVGVKRGHSDGRTFGEWLHDSILADRDIDVFGDVRTNPTTAECVADFVLHILGSGTWPGVHHLGSREALSKAEIALAVAGSAPGYRGRVRVVSVDDAGAGAARPKETWVSTERTEERTCFKMPPASEVVEHLRRQIERSRIERGNRA